SSAHSRLLLSRLAQLRENSRLCDVTLVAEVASLNAKDRSIDMKEIFQGTRISAHRVVLAASTSYFEAMFTNDMAESRLKEIEIKDVKASALEALVDFCYSGKIKINSTNVWTVLATACLLQLNEVQVGIANARTSLPSSNSQQYGMLMTQIFLQEQCGEFLKKEINNSNCLRIRAFADAHACKELLSFANKYILHNFKDVIGTDEFYRLPGNQLVELISSEELQVPSEDQVFKAVVEWVRFDLPARQQVIPTGDGCIPCRSELFEHVRLPFCHPQFLVSTVSKDTLVKADGVCRNLVEEAK
ncbi:BTB And Kelch, partial [Ostertagia ostertagi]